MAIASNESFSAWTKTFTDPKPSAAIVDRLTFGGDLIETDTDSYRRARPEPTSSNNQTPPRRPPLEQEPSHEIPALGLTVGFAACLGVIPAVIAHRKGHDWLFWWVFGTTMFIVALPTALLMKPTGNPRNTGSSGV